MTTLFEIVIPQRPKTIQASRGEVMTQYKESIQTLANAAKTTFFTGRVWLTLIYICNESPPDTDNVVKPILDALQGVIYGNDSIVSDVDSHRRYLAESLDMTTTPPALLRALNTRWDECVYVRVIPLYDSWIPLVLGPPK